MNKLIRCFNLDTGASWYFDAKTPYNAMEKLIYSLNLQNKDESARIKLAGNGRTLYVEHSGQTWGCANANEGSAK